MSDGSYQEEAPRFAHLWPWPGNLFLVLFAAWLFYMGTIAEVADVRSAFFGLGVVTGVVLLLGIRAWVVGPHLRRRRERAALAASEAEDEDDEGRTGATGAPALPVRREASFSLTSDLAGLADENDELVFARSRPRRGELADALRQLEARLNRDRAERGAQIAQLDQALARRLAEVVARVDKLSGAGAAGAGADGADTYLKVEAFNNAVNSRIIPRVEAMIHKALSERLEPQALRAALGDATHAGETGAGGADPQVDRRLDAMDGRLAAVDQRAGAIAADAARLREEMQQTIASVVEHLGRVGEATQDIVARVERIGAGALTAGGVPAMPGAPATGEASTEAEVAALRQALTTIIEQNREIRQQQERLSEQFEAPARVQLNTTDHDG